MNSFVARAAAIALTIVTAACGGQTDAPDPAAASERAVDGARPVAVDGPEAGADLNAAAVDEVAEGFVRLALAIGRHDPAYVDAYHGPEEWAAEAEADGRSLAELEADARALADALEESGVEDARTAMLAKNLRAALAFIRMERGEAFSFDEETALLYDAKAPEYVLADFDAALAEMEALAPGEGPLNQRVDAFRESLAIPEERLEAVFAAAIAECRKRTAPHIGLPPSERFTTGYVTDKPWSGYNWYQGDYESLIEVNTDLPVIIDRAVDLGCHEGYPGHHTWNVLIERDLLSEKGWIEYSVYPLFSPLSLIAEGSANYGIELAFPGEEKIAFERDVLFPLAGLDPTKAETLAALNKASRKLSHARNHVARSYLDGEISREEAVEMAMKYGVTSRERAEKSVDFIETYRGYVINYNLGLDLVRAYVDREVAAGADPWDAFTAILTAPTSASDLVAAG